jgi:acyl-CoA thioesterase FadM
MISYGNIMQPYYWYDMPSYWLIKEFKLYLTIYYKDQDMGVHVWHINLTIYYKDQDMGVHVRHISFIRIQIRCLLRQ